MNLGALLGVEAIERQEQSDDIRRFAGLGRHLPLSAAVLALCLLSLAGFPPFGGFIGKTYLFGAALGAGWTWLAIVMLLNVALSLFYYVRVLEPMYLRSSTGKPLRRESTGLRFALVVLGIRKVVSGVVPPEWRLLFTHASSPLSADLP